MFHDMRALTVIGILALMALGLALASENAAARSATLGYSCKQDDGTIWKRW